MSFFMSGLEFETIGSDTMSFFMQLPTIPKVRTDWKASTIHIYFNNTQVEIVDTQVENLK